MDRPLARRGGAWRADELEAGPHWLSAVFPGLAIPQQVFVVEEGRETRIAVALAPGVERTLVFTPPPGVEVRSGDVLVRAESWEVTWPLFGPGPLACSLTLAPGRYALEATADGGLRAAGVLEIADLSVPQAEVSFELR